MKDPAEPFPVRKVTPVLLLKTTALAGSGRDGDISREVDQYFTLDGQPIFKADSCRGEPATLDVSGAENFTEECRTYIAYLSDALTDDGEAQLTVEGDTLRRVLAAFRTAVNDRRIFEAKLFALEKLRELGIVMEWDESEKAWRMEAPEETTALQAADPQLYDVLTRFSLAMAADLLRADQEGKTGWGDEDEREHFRHELMQHYESSRWIGAANFCMFLHYLDQEKKSADQADAGGSEDGG